MSGLEVSSVETSVVREVRPFAGFPAVSLSMVSVDNNTIIEIHTGSPNLDFTTKDNIRFRIDYVNVPFHIIIRSLLGLSMEITVSLMNSILFHFDNFQKGSLDGSLTANDINFLLHIFKSLEKFSQPGFRTRNRTMTEINQIATIVGNLVTKLKSESMMDFNKKFFVPQYVDILHSLQNSVDDDWVIELVFPPTTEDVGSVRKELKDFFTSPTSKNLQEVNEPHFNRILKVLASSLHVKNGFTGDNRETPIPSSSFIFDTRVTYINSQINNTNDLLAKSIFRHIGVQLKSGNLIFLLTMLCYSDQVTLKPNVKEVIRAFLSRDEVSRNVSYLFRKPTSVLMWKVMNSLPENVVENTILFNGDCTSFYYHFSKWFSKSSLKSVISISDCANAFHIGGDFFGPPVKPKPKSSQSESQFNESLSKIPSNRSFYDWCIILESGAFLFLSKRFLENFSCDVDGSSFLKQLSDEGRTETISMIEQGFDEFNRLLIEKGFRMGSCVLCDKSNMLSHEDVWRKMNCRNGCDSHVHICTSCYNRNYNSTPEPGHVLELAKISCIQCRSLLENVDIRFPTGTALETIVELSNQFYSCCTVGCRNFIHVPPEDGVLCADRLEHVQDIFCEQHINGISTELQTMMKPCPGCNHMIFKVEGCNHMTCTQCGTEFCMRPECTYHVGRGTPFTHPSYCRSGISDEITVASLNHIILTIMSDLRFNQIMSTETETTISSILTNIVFMGLNFELYTKLYEILDYINLYNRQNPNKILLGSLLSDLSTLIARHYPEIQREAVVVVL